MARSLTMGPVTASRQGAASRVGVTMAGEPLWFESADLAIGESAEAFAGCALMPAVAAGRRLELATPVSALWLANVGRMLEIWKAWWGYPALPPLAPARPAAGPRAGGTVLCFSGGVDSFHTLLRGPRPPDALAFVHGYDIPLTDLARLAPWERSLREVAAELGARALLLRTNLRRHRLAARCPWNRWHGGALAAVGHLLTAQAGNLLISSSFPPSYGYRWGSHAELDPLWSSDRLTVIHHGASHSRLGKVREIIGHELVRRHLRVCWQNRVVSGNCSRCDKCLCTMALISICGAHGKVPAFDWSGTLSEHIDRLPRTLYVHTYRELLEQETSGRLSNAVRALLERTVAASTLRERAVGLLQWVRQACNRPTW